jgi:hypothetical protein
VYVTVPSSTQDGHVGVRDVCVNVHSSTQMSYPHMSILCTAGESHTHVFLSSVPPFKHRTVGHSANIAIQRFFLQLSFKNVVSE